MKSAAILIVSLFTSVFAHASNCHVASITQEDIVVTCPGDHVFAVNPYDVATILGEPRTHQGAIHAIARVEKNKSQEDAFLTVIDHSLPGSKSAIVLYGSTEDAQSASKAESVTIVAKK